MPATYKNYLLNFLPIFIKGQQHSFPFTNFMIVVGIPNQNNNSSTSHFNTHFTNILCSNYFLNQKNKNKNLMCRLWFLSLSHELTTFFFFHYSQPTTWYNHNKMCLKIYGIKIILSILLLLFFIGRIIHLINIGHIILVCLLICHFYSILLPSVFYLFLSINS